MAHLGDASNAGSKYICLYATFVVGSGAGLRRVAYGYGGDSIRVEGADVTSSRETLCLKNHRKTIDSGAGGVAAGQRVRVSSLECGRICTAACRPVSPPPPALHPEIVRNRTCGVRNRAFRSTYVGGYVPVPDGVGGSQVVIE